MNPTKLSSESENLSIHYICFNIQGFIELEDIKKIAFIYLNHLVLIQLL
jgi:hypothetical protein